MAPATGIVIQVVSYSCDIVHIILVESTKYYCGGCNLTIISRFTKSYCLHWEGGGLLSEIDF